MLTLTFGITHFSSLVFWLQLWLDYPALANQHVLSSGHSRTKLWPKAIGPRTLNPCIFLELLGKWNFLFWLEPTAERIIYNSEMVGVFYVGTDWLNGSKMEESHKTEKMSSGGIVWDPDSWLVGISFYLPLSSFT